MAHEIDIRVSTKVTLAMRWDIGGNTASVEMDAETPKLTADEIGIRAQALASVVRKAIENFVRPADAPYQSVQGES